jgi:hypothetical protein
LNYYNNIDNIIKDKEIKYIRFIGKEPMTSEDIEEVLNNKIKEKNEYLLFRRRKDVNRYKIEFEDICPVYKNNEYLLKPTFDINQNDKFFKTRHYFNIFLKMLTKVLIRNRAEKRLKCINNMIKNNNIKTPDDFHEYMEKDWINYLTKESQSEDNKIKLKFIPLIDITRTQLYNSNEYNINSLKQDIPHDNNINLQELKSYTPLDRNEIEASNYKGMIFII